MIHHEHTSLSIVQESLKSNPLHNLSNQFPEQFYCRSMYFSSMELNPSLFYFDHHQGSFSYFIHNQSIHTLGLVSSTPKALLSRYIPFGKKYIKYPSYSLYSFRNGSPFYLFWKCAFQYFRYYILMQCSMLSKIFFDNFSKKQLLSGLLFLRYKVRGYVPCNQLNQFSWILAT